MGLLLWSKNIGSWHKHASSFLTDAAEAGVGILALQETNLGPHAVPAALNLARRMGWNMLHVRQTGRRRGGVALLTRPLFALRLVVQHAADDCKWLFAEVLGAHQSLTIGSACRVLDNDASNLTYLVQELEGFRGRLWSLALDANCNQTRGVFSQSMSATGACLAATARL